MKDYTIKEVSKLAPVLSDWYWNYGHKRKGVYALNRSSWLAAIANLGRGANSIHFSETKYKKPALALWGPSQTGKSTLLADYIDGDCDKYGNGSALQWCEKDPVRFVGDICGGEVTVLNPFNKGADASGCVTRYVSRDSVDVPEYPVQLTLASESQIIHGLAVGYLSETIAQDSEDQVVKLSAELVKKWVSEFAVKGPPLPASRDAFEYLVEVANVVDLLILSNIERYENLKKEWSSSLRRELLESEALLANIDTARAFAKKLFWDSWTSISNTYDQLTEKLKDIGAKFGGAEIHMTYKFAAQVLNISAVELAERSPIIQKIIDDASYEIVGGRVLIGADSSRTLFSKLDEFALFQGIVWEIEVPLKSSVLRQNSVDAGDLLKEADLLDFPGVANEFKSADLLTDEALLTQNRLILTKVLKRGKTASIVVTSSRDLNIDGFSLLMRMNHYPSNPVQLNNGIRSWWESYDKSWPPQSKELPLNLVLTFTAKLVNTVADSGVGQGLEDVIEMITRSLKILSDPAIVNTFMTNYPQFSDGKLHVEGEALDQVIKSILEDRAFQRQLGDNAKSLKEMSKSGGKDYFLKALQKQASTSNRPALVREKKIRLLADFRRLLAEAFPGDEDPSSKRCRDLDEISTAIQTRLNEGDGQLTTNDVGRVVQSLVNIDYKILDDLPKHSSRKAQVVNKFLVKQFAGWREERSQQFFNDGVGLDDPSKVNRLLSYMIEAVDIDQLQQWVCQNLGNIKSRSESSESRRFLATKMNNEILDFKETPRKRKHRAPCEIAPMVKAYADSEMSGTTDLSSSPYYAAIIMPFLSKLESLKSSNSSERGVQPGDNELMDAIKDLN